MIAAYRNEEETELSLNDDDVPVLDPNNRHQVIQSTTHNKQYKNVV